MGNWAETTAAYRFLGNDEVSWDDVFTAHAHASRARMKEHPMVLCLRNTTELDFNSQELTGLGPLSYKAQRGLCSALTPSWPDRPTGFQGGSAQKNRNWLRLRP